jgi:hypothetical protein
MAWIPTCTILLQTNIRMGPSARPPRMINGDAASLIAPAVVPIPDVDAMWNTILSKTLKNTGYKGDVIINDQGQTEFYVTLRDRLPIHCSKIKMAAEGGIHIFYAEYQSGKTFVIDVFCTHACINGNIPVVFLNVNDKDTLADLEAKIAKFATDICAVVPGIEVLNVLGKDQSKVTEVLRDSVNGGKKIFVGLAHHAHIKMITSCATMLEAEMRRPIFPRIRVMVDEIQNFMCFAKTKSKDPESYGELQNSKQSEEELKKLLFHNGVLRVGGFSVIAATILDTSLMAERLGLADYKLAQMDVDTRERFRENGYRGLKDMTLVPLLSRYGPLSFYGFDSKMKFSKNVERTRKRSGEDARSVFDGDTFAERGDKSDFAQEIRDWLDDGYVGNEGVSKLIMTTKNVHADSNVFQLGRVIKRSYPDYDVIVKTGGKGIYTIVPDGNLEEDSDDKSTKKSTKKSTAFRGTYKQCLESLSRVDEQGNSYIKVVTITNCGIASFTYNHHQYPITHVYVYAAEGTNIQTLAQGYGRGTGSFMRS